MRIKLTLAIVLLATAVAACQPGTGGQTDAVTEEATGPSGQADSPTTEVTATSVPLSGFTDERQGVNIQVPDGWVTDESLDGTVLAESQEAMDRDDIAAIIATRWFPDDAETPLGLIDDFLAAQSEGAGESGEVEELEIDGVPAAAVEYLDVEADLSLYVVVILQPQERLVSFVGFAESSRWAEVEPLVRDVAASIVLLDADVSPPTDAAQVEGGVVSFLIDFIIEAEIQATADYIASWMEAPEANIIIWAPAEEMTTDSWEYVDVSAPIQVWWYTDNELAESEDMLADIDRYEQLYMSNPSDNIFAWGYYEIGIVSVSDDLEEVVVYVGASCGPLCGHGYYYTLRWIPTGYWHIVDDEFLWQS